MTQLQGRAQDHGLKGKALAEPTTQILSSKTREEKGLWSNITYSPQTDEFDFSWLVICELRASTSLRASDSPPISALPLSTLIYQHASNARLLRLLVVSYRLVFLLILIS